MRGVAKGTVSAIAYARLGDITTDQFRALASIPRELGLDVRLTNRQNIVFRDLTETQLPTLYARLEAIGMAEPGAELARDVVACPGADTCNLAVTQSRGLADAIGTALEEAGLAEVGGVRTNISGLHQLLRSAPRGRHRLLRRRAPGPRPVGPRATRCCSAATWARSRCTSARRRCACRPATPPRPPSGWCASSPSSVRPARTSAGGSTARAARRPSPTTLRDLDVFPSPTKRPSYYVDFGETGPYVAEIGESECAT